MAWKALGGDNRRSFGKTAALLDTDDISGHSIALAIEDAGATCRRVADIEQLLSLILAGDADFALVARDLPDDRCRRVLSAIRSNPSSRDFPVVVLVAEPTDARVFDSYSAGADLVLAKPLEQEVIAVLLGSAI